MSTLVPALTRMLTRLAVCAVAVVVTGLGSVAHASRPGPDVISDGIPALDPVTPVIQVAPSVTIPTSQPFAWALTGAAVGVAAAAVVILLVVLYRRRALARVPLSA